MSKIKIAIILRPVIKDEFKAVIVNLLRWLTKRGVSFYFLKSEEEKLKKIFSQISSEPDHFISPKELENMNFLLSLGGDGTLIGLCRMIKSKTPIIGVNWGRLGFITEFNAESMYQCLTKVIEGDYRLKKCPLFTVRVYLNGKVIYKEKFINDLVISRNDISRLFAVKVECQDESLIDIAGDGLILSTPIGSTAPLASTLSSIRQRHSSRYHPPAGTRATAVIVSPAMFGITLVQSLTESVFADCSG